MDKLFYQGFLYDDPAVAGSCGNPYLKKAKVLANNGGVKLKNHTACGFLVKVVGPGGNRTAAAPTPRAWTTIILWPVFARRLCLAVGRLRRAEGRSELRRAKPTREGEVDVYLYFVLCSVLIQSVHIFTLLPSILAHWRLGYLLEREVGL